MNARIEENRVKEKEYANISSELKAERSSLEQHMEADKQRKEKSERERDACEQEFLLKLAEYDTKEEELRTELISVLKADLQGKE